MKNIGREYRNDLAHQATWSASFSEYALRAAPSGPSSRAPGTQDVEDR